MARAGQPGATESLQSLERGISVIQVFSREHPALTLSEVAAMTGITRATARRILLTLQKLGHVRQEGRRFSLTPRVLTLGWAYLSSLGLWEVAAPLMKELVRTTGESSSAATLDLPDIVYVARVPTTRITSVVLGLGTRLPAHATSMGRVLLADLPQPALAEYLAGPEIRSHTERTVTDPGELRELVDEVREQGWALVDQELEMGLRSIAAPIRHADGSTVAALNVSGAVARTSVDDLRETFLPHLLATAEEISRSLIHSNAAGMPGVGGGGHGGLSAGERRHEAGTGARARARNANDTRAEPKEATA